MTSEQGEDLLDQPLVFLQGAPVDVEEGEIVEVGWVKGASGRYPRRSMAWKQERVGSGLSVTRMT